MASYTKQLRSIIEQATQFEQGLSLDEKIEIGRKKLFNFHYPFFNESYRKQFETNFIRKFYMREIGFEVEGLFKFQLETWLNINMPYFNELFESEQIKYDPLINTFMTTERDSTSNKDQTDDRTIAQTSQTDGTSSGNMSQNSTSENEAKDDNFSRRVGSENPDSRLQLQTQQGKGVIEYASDIDENKVDNKATASGKANTKTDSTDRSHVDSKADQEDKRTSNIDEMEKFLERRSGKIGIESQAKLIQDYRSALLRIEVQIHREMNELFMLVY